MSRRETNVYCPKDPPEYISSNFFGLRLDEEQEAFVNAIWNPENIIVFCNARAGSGKTTLAAGMAQLLYQYHITENGIIYCVSPYAEKTQGYLKGDLKQKSEPYFVPFIEALYEINVNPMTAIKGNCQDGQKNGSAYIECMTHTFLRGTNFKEQTIIIDEAQNYNVEEIKKTLTRCADSCKIIVIGHTGQIDLPNKRSSGFEPYMEWFRNEPYAQVCTLTKNYRGVLSTKADEYQSNEREK